MALAQDQMVCLSPAPSFWKEELTFVSSAPCPCLCLPTVWLELPSSHLLSLHSLPWQPSVSLLLMVPDPHLCGCLHYNVCPNKLRAFETGCGMQRKWSLLGSSSKWTLHFSKEILKTLDPRQTTIKAAIFIPFLTPHRNGEFVFTFLDISSPCGSPLQNGKF